jgi:hypothetical protein
MGRGVKALALAGLRPIITAFSIWFLHFMVCWAAGEIWPHQWAANAVAWGATAIALLAICMHFVQVKAQQADRVLSAWTYRFAQGAIAIATTGVLFSALPSILFLP